MPPRDRILMLKQNLTEEEAFKHEMYMISVLGRKDNNTGILHNLTNGGEGVKGQVRDSQWREKQSKAQKGKKMSDEFRRKRSEYMMGNTNTLGRVASAREREKISKGLREFWDKVAAGEIENPQKGRKDSDETRQKKRKMRLGKKQSDKQKEAVSSKMKKYWDEVRQGIRPAPRKRQPKYK